MRVVDCQCDQLRSNSSRSPNLNASIIKFSDSKFLISHLFINLLKPTGHVMHQQFNIQQLYVLPTLYLCVLYLSENKQQLVPFTA